jgi:DUF971 family protein
MPGCYQHCIQHQESNSASLAQTQVLQVEFDDGVMRRFSAELLRVGGRQLQRLLQACEHGVDKVTHK